jgi:AcrR family transcriptional regulator
MRYEKGHKNETRQHIVDVAARRFREDGIAGAGVASLMADAGLTNGAFYGHFESKEELVREALLGALDRRKDLLEANARAGLGPETWISSYLSPRHRDQPGSGCFTAALVAELARHPKATRDAFTAKFTDILKLLADQLPAGSPEVRRRTATALYGMMIGTLQLSRAVSDKQLSTQILEDGVTSARALVDHTGT